MISYPNMSHHLIFSHFNGHIICLKYHFVIQLKILSKFTVVHHALQDWALTCLKMVEYWAKSIMQSLLGFIEDLALFLINSVTVRGFRIKSLIVAEEHW